MSDKTKIIFLALVLTQALHSIEEYIGKLWEVFPPARYLTGLISRNHETGFIIINVSIFLFGLWCWLMPIRKNLTYATGLIWVWIIIELINGIGHPAWALYRQSYEPGVATAPLLLVLSIYLIRSLFIFQERKK